MGWGWSYKGQISMWANLERRHTAEGSPSSRAREEYPVSGIDGVPQNVSLGWQKNNTHRGTRTEHTGCQAPICLHLRSGLRCQSPGAASVTWCYSSKWKIISISKTPSPFQDIGFMTPWHGSLCIVHLEINLSEFRVPCGRVSVLEG